MACSTSSVLMVRPRHFGPNSETAGSNAFQQPSAAEPSALQARAIAEFDVMVDVLRAAGVRVVVGHDSDAPPKPDAVFPNNWVSFHDDGNVIVYPLEARSRRPERRLDLIDQACREGGFHVGRLVDLSWLERDGAFLEGTGSLVLDRVHRVAYAALSSRTHPAALAEFTRQTGIEVVSFNTRDEHGRPVYHTNVLLSLGTDFAVICPEAIIGSAERGWVVDRIALTGRRVIEISLAQMRGFAANVLELDTGGQGPVVIMSAAARAAFTAPQLADLERCARPLAVPLETIERVGGGGARCMLAEIFLPTTQRPDSK